MAPLTISATKAKLQFGKMLMKVKEGNPIVIEKNDQPAIVWISIDDYEDFLELKDTAFQKTITKGYREIKKGKFGTLDELYNLHKKRIAGEAK